MVINAFNSGASTYMADFEDASRQRGTTIQGQINCAMQSDAKLLTPVRKEEVHSKQTDCCLDRKARGWHLDEKHVFVHGKPILPHCLISGCLCFIMQRNF